MRMRTRRPSSRESNADRTRPSRSSVNRENKRRKRGGGRWSRLLRDMEEEEEEEAGECMRGQPRHQGPSDRAEEEEAEGEEEVTDRPADLALQAPRTQRADPRLQARGRKVAARARAREAA